MENGMNNVPQGENVEQSAFYNNINEQQINSGAFSEITPENNNEPKKKGKVLPIVIGIFLFIIIAAFGVFFYFKSQRTATKYVEGKVEEVKKSIEENFSKNAITNIGNFDIVNDDIKTSGKLKISTSGTNLALLDGTELTFDAKLSLANEYLEANLGAKDKNTSIQGTLYFDGTKAYLNSKDLYDTPIFTDTGDNLFHELKAEFEGSDMDLAEFKELLDVNNLKDFSLKIVDYLEAALKETLTSTNQRGLSVEYVYTFNEETSRKFSDMFVELIEKDPLYGKYFTEIIETPEFSDIDVGDGEISDELILKIEVGLFDNKIKNITAISNDKVVLSKVEDNKYKLLYNSLFGLEDQDEGNYALLTIKDDEFSAKIFVDGQEYISFYLISKKNESTLKIDAKSYGMSFEINTKDISKNETKMSIKANLAVATITADANIKADKNKTSISGNLNVSLSALLTGSAETIKLDYDLSVENGKGIVTKDLPKNATSEFDDSILEENLVNKISNLGIYQLLGSYFMTNDYEDDYYYYDDNYDYDSFYDFNL